MLEVFLWFIIFSIFCNLHDIHCSPICAYHFVKRRHSINTVYFSHKYDHKLCFPFYTQTSVSKIRSIKIGLDFTWVEVCLRTKKLSELRQNNPVSWNTALFMHNIHFFLYIFLYFSIEVIVFYIFCCMNVGYRGHCTIFSLPQMQSILSQHSIHGLRSSCCTFYLEIPGCQHSWKWCLT